MAAENALTLRQACSSAAILNVKLFVIARRVLAKTGGDTARPIGIARIKR
jgi:hypothetical protein